MRSPPHAWNSAGLRRRFGGAAAVDDLSLAVPAGSFYGLVGPNGAGKTTTLSMATGLLRPDAGIALVHGVDVWQRPLDAKPLIGNLADGVDLYDRLTGEQLITFSGLLSDSIVRPAGQGRRPAAAPRSRERRPGASSPTTPRA